MAPNVPGFLKTAGIIASCPAVLEQVYSYAWFVGFFIGAWLYLALMTGKGAAPGEAPEGNTAAAAAAADSC